MSTVCLVISTVWFMRSVISRRFRFWSVWMTWWILKLFFLNGDMKTHLQHSITSCLCRGLWGTGCWSGWIYPYLILLQHTHTHNHTCTVMVKTWELTPRQKYCSQKRWWLISRLTQQIAVGYLINREPSVCVCVCLAYLPPSVWNRNLSSLTSCWPGWAEMRNPHTVSPEAQHGNKREEKQI